MTIQPGRSAAASSVAGGLSATAKTLARGPKAARGGLARIDVRTRQLLDVVPFYYNPDTVTRTLQPRAVAAEPGDRLEAFRLTGPPHETIKVEVELDAADQLDQPDQNTVVAAHGLLPFLATLEQMITPTASSLSAVDALHDKGELEILPQQAPMVVLIWSPDRVVPVAISTMTITEEAFDRALHPIRAKVSIDARTLSNDDLPADHVGTAMYLAYRQGVERLAAITRQTDVRQFGLSRLP